MIALLDGVVASRTLDAVIIDVHGVGYLVHVPAGTPLPVVGETVRLFTYLHVREDALTLYGFGDMAAKDLFTLLITASGVGPKLALTMLSTLPSDILITALRARDTDTLTAVPGIGKKVAERLVLELHEKAAGLHVTAAMSFATKDPTQSRQVFIDVHEALVALGYSTSEADKAISAIAAETTDDASVLLRAALNALSYTVKGP